MVTIYDATAECDAICLMGANRQHTIGDIAYKFKRKFFPNGMAETLPTFARGAPVMYVDGQWRDTQLAVPVIRNWTDVVTVVEHIPR